MQYEWDEEKNRANEGKHGIAFEAVETGVEPQELRGGELLRLTVWYQWPAV